MGPAQSGPMKIRVRADLVYRFDPPTDAIYKIQVAHWPGQSILEERLTTLPEVEFIDAARQSDRASAAEGALVPSAPAGTAAISYPAGAPAPREIFWRRCRD